MKAGALIASLPLAGRVGRAKRDVQHRVQRRPGWGCHESQSLGYPHPARLRYASPGHPPHKGEGEEKALAHEL
jgi:hypothetical protein